MIKASLRTEIWFIGPILIASILFSAAVGIHRNYGDGNSYYTMTSSLVKDGDFILNNKDIVRCSQDRHQYMPLPFGVYVLIDKKGIIRYAEPVLYPLLSAPFFLLFGKYGFLFLNSLFLAGIIILGYLFLREYFNRIYSFFISVVFIFGSFIPVYTSWVHQEMMLFFACSLCVWLLFKNKPLPAAVIIGIAGSSKIIFLLLLIPLVSLLISEKKIWELKKALAACFLSLSIMFFINYLFLGQFIPYYGKYGGVSIRNFSHLSLEAVKNTFIGCSQFIGMQFNSWGLFLRNILSFFIGRFTGIIWYAFPQFVMAATYLIYRRRISREERIKGDSILAAAFLLMVTLIVFRPLNYFGGKDFVCNRYFFITPALLFLPAIRLIKDHKTIILLFLPGILISSQIVRNEISIEECGFNRYHLVPGIHGIHTSAFPLEYAPLEIAQIESLPVSGIRISNSAYLYAPLGIKEKVGKRILVDKGQELVVVQNNCKDGISFETNYGEILMRSEDVLKSRVDGKCKIFYYFKAGRMTWINKIAGANLYSS